MYTIKIDGMMCENCQKRVEGAFANLKINAKVFPNEGKAEIYDENVDITSLLEEIEDLGFETKLINN